MPFLFLSPSTQYFNPYITTGDERYWMNALADEMMPYLHASGITVTRNDPDGSAAQSIRDSNASRQDFHLALHSNAAPQALSGQLRGVDIYYYPTSEAGLRMANILVDDIRPVYRRSSASCAGRGPRPFWPSSDTTTTRRTQTG